MIYRALADLVLVVHLGFVLFVVLGGLLVVRWPWLAWLHVPAAVWGVLIEFMGWICPLTPLENSFRVAGGGAGYSGGFIEHYIRPILYPAGLTRRTGPWPRIDAGAEVGFLVTRAWQAPEPTIAVTWRGSRGRRRSRWTTHLPD